MARGSANRLRQVQAEAIARTLPNLFDSLVSSPVLAERAVVIAGKLDHAVYDCFYLALAEARDTPLVTADFRLLRRLDGTAWSARVRPVTDYRTGE